MDRSVEYRRRPDPADSILVLDPALVLRMYPTHSLVDFLIDLLDSTFGLGGIDHLLCTLAR